MSQVHRSPTGLCRPDPVGLIMKWNFHRIGVVGVVMTVAALCSAPSAVADDGWVAVANSPNHEQQDWAYGPDQFTAEANVLAQCAVLQRADDLPGLGREHRLRRHRLGRERATQPNLCRLRWRPLSRGPRSHRRGRPLCQRSAGPLHVVAARHTGAAGAAGAAGARDGIDRPGFDLRPPRPGHTICR